MCVTLHVHACQLFFDLFSNACSTIFWIFVTFFFGFLSCSVLLNRFLTSSQSTAWLGADSIVLTNECDFHTHSPSPTHSHQIPSILHTWIYYKSSSDIETCHHIYNIDQSDIPTFVLISVQSTISTPVFSFQFPLCTIEASRDPIDFRM